MSMYNGAFILAIAAKATAILAGGAVVTSALRQSAAARYLTWICVFAAILMLPVLSLQSWTIAVPAPAAISQTVVPSAVHRVPTGSVPAAAPEFSWLRAAAVIWLGGVVFLLFRIGAGHLKARAIRRRAKRVNHPAWLESFEEASALTSTTGRATLFASDEIDVPVSYGFLHPAIVLGGNFENWTADRRRAVLIHELTHVRRRDTLLTLLAQLSTAVYWIHPLAWFAQARFRKEQECSCDDAVLQAGVAEADYADHLVSVARSFEPTSAWPVAPAMARASHLEERVRSLLDPSRRRLTLTPRMCAIGTAALVAIIVPLAAVRAQDASSASLSGSVYDASGAAIPRVSVSLSVGNGKIQEMTITGPDGTYTFTRVRPGNYTLQVRAPGFAMLNSPVFLEPGAAIKVDPKLELGSTMETVEVVGRGTASAAPAGPPQRIRVGGNVQATKLLKKVNPEYPANAQAAGIAGTVVLRAVISTSGDLLNLAVVNTPDTSLAQAATAAVSQWKYQATLLNGEPVEVVTTVAVNFKLQP